MSEKWDGFRFPPPGYQAGQKEHVIEVNISGKAGLFFPLPIWAGELETFVRPSASVCFPLHPLGVAKIYEEAILAFQNLGASMGAPSMDYLRKAIWRASVRSFVPGMPVRTGFDRLAEKHLVGLNVSLETSEANDRQATQDWLAVWAVMLALIQMGKVEP